MKEENEQNQRRGGGEGKKKGRKNKLAINYFFGSRYCKGFRRNSRFNGIFSDTKPCVSDQRPLRGWPTDSRHDVAESPSPPTTSKSFSAASSSLPADSKSLPVDLRSFPVDARSLRVDLTSLAAVVRSFSANSRSLPVHLTSLPADARSLPVVDVRSRPPLARLLPVDWRSLPADVTSLPAKRVHTRSTFGTLSRLFSAFNRRHGAVQALSRRAMKRRDLTSRIRQSRRALQEETIVYIQRLQSLQAYLLQPKHNSADEDDDSDKSHDSDEHDDDNDDSSDDDDNISDDDDATDEDDDSSDDDDDNDAAAAAEDAAAADDDDDDDDKEEEGDDGDVDDDDDDDDSNHNVGNKRGDNKEVDSTRVEDSNVFNVTLATQLLRRMSVPELVSTRNKLSGLWYALTATSPTSHSEEPAWDDDDEDDGGDDRAFDNARLKESLSRMTVGQQQSLLQLLARLMETFKGKGGNSPTTAASQEVGVADICCVIG